MPFPMKIQPLDSQAYGESIRNDTAKPVLKSRLKRLFDRQFPNVLRISSTEKLNSGESAHYAGKDGVATAEFEPSSVCLDKMVQNFFEETTEKQSAVKCGRNRCNCFNGNNNDSSDDEFDIVNTFGDSFTNNSSFGDSSDSLKSLIPCSSVTERNLLADASKIVEKNRTCCKRKDEVRNALIDGLLSLGYEASMCKSRWENSSSCPAGEYEYIDVVVEGERVLVDVDFRSEFEIARPTGSYKAILQSLPYIFVGGDDRLQQIVAIVSEAAKLSLKKKGMHIPPWRKVEYMRAKWLSSHTRTTPPPPQPPPLPPSPPPSPYYADKETDSECGELELIFGEKTAAEETPTDGKDTEYAYLLPSPAVSSAEGGKRSAVVGLTWKPPAIKPKSKVLVTGLAALLKEKP